MGISEWSDDQAKGKMAIQFDNGEEWLVELRGSGWIKDCKEGKSWRMKKLGGLTSLDVKKERDKQMGKKEKICEKLWIRIRFRNSLASICQGWPMSTVGRYV